MLPLALLAALAPVTGSPLAVIRPAPAFELTNQDNKTVRLEDLRGQVLPEHRQFFALSLEFGGEGWGEG